MRCDYQNLDTLDMFEDDEEWTHMRVECSSPGDNNSTVVRDFPLKKMRRKLSKKKEHKKKLFMRRFGRIDILMQHLPIKNTIFNMDVLQINLKTPYVLNMPRYSVGVEYAGYNAQGLRHILDRTKNCNFEESFIQVSLYDFMMKIDTSVIPIFEIIRHNLDTKYTADFKPVEQMGVVLGLDKEDLPIMCEAIDSSKPYLRRVSRRLVNDSYGYRQLEIRGMELFLHVAETDRYSRLELDFKLLQPLGLMSEEECDTIRAEALAIDIKEGNLDSQDSDDERDELDFINKILATEAVANNDNTSDNQSSDNPHLKPSDIDETFSSYSDDDDEDETSLDCSESEINCSESLMARSESDGRDIFDSTTSARETDYSEMKVNEHNESTFVPLIMQATELFVQRSRVVTFPPNTNNFNKSDVSKSVSLDITSDMCSMNSTHSKGTSNAKKMPTRRKIFETEQIPQKGPMSSKIIQDNPTQQLPVKSEKTKGIRKRRSMPKMQLPQASAAFSAKYEKNQGGKRRIRKKLDRETVHKSFLNLSIYDQQALLNDLKQ